MLQLRFHAPRPAESAESPRLMNFLCRLAVCPSVCPSVCSTARPPDRQTGRPAGSSDGRLDARAGPKQRQLGVSSLVFRGPARLLKLRRLAQFHSTSMNLAGRCRCAPMGQSQRDANTRSAGHVCLPLANKPDVLPCQIERTDSDCISLLHLSASRHSTYSSRSRLPAFRFSVLAGELACRPDVCPARSRSRREREKVHWPARLRRGSIAATRRQVRVHS